MKACDARHGVRVVQIARCSASTSKNCKISFCTFARSPFAPFESDRKTMKNASGKCPPDEAHSCTAPHSKIRLNFVKYLRILFLQFHPQNFAYFFCILIHHSPISMKLFRNFSNLQGKDQNLLDDYQISCDFSKNIFENFRQR